ncbi:MAG: hypothetical protein RBS76_01140 [Acholeplasmatales bacterium]|nr:hypothetical protein [Acholeplasmataceae bacterium]MCK9233909.1 hypothetical protein [Acholeplasmataceae bacterium]MCK9427072.1 hypothetical protein [Acholeplasmataceae bacterium]MDY0115084.1 hypothetical protein [Acholeplasmatales bacterium]
MTTTRISLSRKLSCSLDHFIESLFDYQLMKNYQQPPLISYQLVKGNFLEEGAVVKLFYDNEKTKVITETIIKNNLPKEIIIEQKYFHVLVIIKHRFNNNIWFVDYQFITTTKKTIDKEGLAKQLEEDMEGFLKYYDKISKLK